MFLLSSHILPSASLTPNIYLLESQVSELEGFEWVTGVMDDLL